MQPPSGKVCLARVDRRPPTAPAATRETIQKTATFLRKGNLSVFYGSLSVPRDECRPFTMRRGETSPQTREGAIRVSIRKLGREMVRRDGSGAHGPQSKGGDMQEKSGANSPSWSREDPTREIRAARGHGASRDLIPRSPRGPGRRRCWGWRPGLDLRSEIYRELIRLHREEGLDFSAVVTFNLDEYYPMEPSSLHSYHRFMWENLFEHVEHRGPATCTSPAATIPRAAGSRSTRWSTRAGDRGGGAGSISRSWASGKEPGPHRISTSRARARPPETRLVDLDTITRRVARGRTSSGRRNVPTQAITMGVGTIMESREIALLADRRAQGRHRASRGSRGRSIVRWPPRICSSTPIGDRLSRCRRGPRTLTRRKDPLAPG